MELKFSTCTCTAKEEEQATLIKLFRMSIQFACEALGGM